MNLIWNDVMDGASVSPTKNSSGGGFPFEDRVVALFLLDLLLEKPFDQSDERLVQVDVQTEPDGWKLDDLLLHYQREDGNDRLVPAEIKSSAILQNKSKRTSLVRDAWTDFLSLERRPRAFRSNDDRLGLFTAIHERADFEVINELIRKARAQDDEVFRRVNTPGHLGHAKKWLSRLDCPTDLAADFRVTDTVRRTFLSCLCLRQFDFDANDSNDESHAIERCRMATASESPQDGESLWKSVIQIAQELRRAGGNCTRSKLIVKLSGCALLKDAPRYATTWRHLKQVCEHDRDEQRCVIGHKIQLPRTEFVTAVTEKALVRSVVLLGPSGCGKSGIAAIVARNLRSRGCALWFTPNRAVEIAERGGRASVSSDLTLHELVANASTSTGWLFIDGLDRVMGEAQWNAVANALNSVAPAGSSWHVIATCQDEHWPRVRRMLSNCGVDIRDWSEQPISLLKPSEIHDVCRVFPAIRPVISQERLADLVSRPRILDILVRGVEDGEVLPTSWIGESHLIRWFWDTRVRGICDLAASTTLESLACRQADREELDTAIGDVIPIDSVQALIQVGLFRENNGRVAFEHDSLADWARLQWLLSRGNELTAMLRQRFDKPLWHRAIRLVAVHKLEQSETVGEWTALIDNCPEVVDFLLDGLVFSANSLALLQKVADRLFENDGLLARRLLRRALILCTVPNRRLIDRINSNSRLSSPFLRTYFRDPRSFSLFWQRLLRFLNNQAARACTTSMPVEAAEAAKLWLQMTTKEWPGRDDAADVALTLAEAWQSRMTIYRRGDCDPTATVMYEAAIAAFPVQPERARTLILRACSRHLPQQSTSQQDIRRSRKHRVPRQAPGEGPERIALEAWPDGPLGEVDPAFREAFLKGNAIHSVFEEDPKLAKEVLLALLIGVRRLRKHGRNRKAIHDGDCGLVHLSRGLSIPHYRSGPYFDFLAQSPVEAIDFVLKLVNFASERADEQSPNPGTGQIASLNCPFGGSNQWLGGENAFAWNRGLMTSCDGTIAPLVSLEKWLGDRFDNGDLIEVELDQIIQGCRSLAIAGVLADVGRRHPQLFDGKLRPLLMSPKLIILDEISQRDCNQFRFGGPETGLDEDFFEEHKAWLFAPYRKMRLLDFAKQHVAPSTINWGELEGFLPLDTFLADVTERFDFLKQFAARRPSNWMSGNIAALAEEVGSVGTKEPDGTAQEVATPLDEAIADVRWLDEALCHEFRFPATEFAHFIQQLPSLKDPTSSSDELTDRMQRHARLGLATFMLVRHPSDLRVAGLYEEYLDYAITENCSVDQFLGMLRVAQGHYCDWPVWLIQIAFAAWIESPNDERLLRWIAHLACFSTGQTKRRIVELAFQNRQRIGNWHLRLMNLLFRWSAGWWEMTSQFAALQPNETFEFSVWWENESASFVDGRLTPVIPCLKDVYLRERPLFHADWRLANRYDEEEIYFRPAPVDNYNVLASIAAGTPALADTSSTDEAIECVTILQQQLSAHLFNLEAFDANGNKLDRAMEDHPLMSDHRILDRIVDEIRGSAEQRWSRLLWEPVIGLGVNAPLWVEYILSKWFWPSLAADAVPRELGSTWRSLLEFATGHPNWRISENESASDRPDLSLWANLLGVDQFAHRYWRSDHQTIVDEAAQFVARPLEAIVRHASTAAPALRWISRSVGHRYRLDALSWIANGKCGATELEDPDDEITNGIAELLDIVWNDAQAGLKANDALYSSYRRILRQIAGTGNSLAIDLEQRVSEGC